MIKTNTAFAKDVEAGLLAHPKRISSKYFYDETGDGLFVKIMNMPEYYLTDCEFEILSNQANAIVNCLETGDKHFNLIELGAGDGTKTIELLKCMKGLDITYMPIDISEHALKKLESRLKKELPWLEVKTQQGEYFQVLQDLPQDDMKVILFLGSNIGNFVDDIARDFLAQLAASMHNGDKLLLGVDKKKEESIVLPAYNDAQGYTSAFNLNLLHRINRELEADFDVEKFAHRPHYDPESGIASSALESLDDQKVFIGALNESFIFEKGELLHTEISRKYDLPTLQDLFNGSGLCMKQVFTDSKEYFLDIIYEKQAL
ncbi:MAG: L-histidine N(alpha)-methyltransferase [Flavobacteriales bacterium]|nr:L-histidine N(alpha)-methyltransferase [Flavobacteriales bacterium]